MFRQTDACVKDSIRFNQHLEPKQIHASNVAPNYNDKFDKAIISTSSDFAACFLASPFSSNLHTYPIFHVITGFGQIISTSSKLKVALEYADSIHILMFNGSVKCKYSALYDFSN
jgi:hypothetical protein